MYIKTLLVILGPTGVGKTQISLSVANALGSPIINADSRQLFKELPIGTAAPTAKEQKQAKHYFVATHSIHDNYNAGQFEKDAIELLEKLFTTHDTILMVGGGMMYIDAVCKGFDNIPNVNTEVREQVKSDFLNNGLQWLQEQVERFDPNYYKEVDIYNPQRLMHALEIYRQTGLPYSTFRINNTKHRNFRVIKVGLQRQRDELYQRINSRVLQMIDMGLIDEAKAVYPFKHLNSLNTVGYKELFDYFDGKTTCEEAIKLIQQHSRNYAKRQLTWFRRQNEINWFDANNVTLEQIIKLI